MGHPNEANEADAPERDRAQADDRAAEDGRRGEATASGGSSEPTGARGALARRAGKLARTRDPRGAAYTGALEAVFAILIAAGIGYWADEHFDRSPLFLFTGVAIGFAAFIYRLLRMRGLVDESVDD